MLCLTPESRKKNILWGRVKVLNLVSHLHVDKLTLHCTCFNDSDHAFIHRLLVTGQQRSNNTMTVIYNLIFQEIL